jgi:hypothetical protein
MNLEKAFKKHEKTLPKFYDVLPTSRRENPFEVFIERTDICVFEEDVESIPLFKATIEAYHI